MLLFIGVAAGLSVYQTPHIFDMSAAQLGSENRQADFISLTFMASSSNG